MRPISFLASLFLLACTGGGTNNHVGPDGGIASSSDGQVSLDIPPGALDSDVQIAIEPVLGEPMAYEFTPDGLTFNQPARITFITPASPDSEPDLLPWGWGLLSESTEVGVETLPNMEVTIWDQGNRIWDQGNRVTTDIEHFSVVSMPGVVKADLSTYISPDFDASTLDTATFAAVMLDDVTPGFQVEFQAPAGIDLASVEVLPRSFFVALLAEGEAGDPEFPESGAVCMLRYWDGGFGGSGLYGDVSWFDAGSSRWFPSEAQMDVTVVGNRVRIRVPAAQLASPFQNWALPGEGLYAAGPTTRFVFGTDFDGSVSIGSPSRPMRWMAGGTVGAVP